MTRFVLNVSKLKSDCDDLKEKIDTVSSIVDHYYDSNKSIGSAWNDPNTARFVSKMNSNRAEYETMIKDSRNYIYHVSNFGTIIRDIASRCYYTDPNIFSYDGDVTSAVIEACKNAVNSLGWAKYTLSHEWAPDSYSYKWDFDRLRDNMQEFIDRANDIIISIGTVLGDVEGAVNGLKDISVNANIQSASFGNFVFNDSIISTNVVKINSETNTSSYTSGINYESNNDLEMRNSDATNMFGKSSNKIYQVDTDIEDGETLESSSGFTDIPDLSVMSLSDNKRIDASKTVQTVEDEKDDVAEDSSVTSLDSVYLSEDEDAKHGNSKTSRKITKDGDIDNNRDYNVGSSGSSSALNTGKNDIITDSLLGSEKGTSSYDGLVEEHDVSGYGMGSIAVEGLHDTELDGNILDGIGVQSARVNEAKMSENNSDILSGSNYSSIQTEGLKKVDLSNSVLDGSSVRSTNVDELRISDESDILDETISHRSIGGVSSSESSRGRNYDVIPGTRSGEYVKAEDAESVFKHNL